MPSIRESFSQLIHNQGERRDHAALGLVSASFVMVMLGCGGEVNSQELFTTTPKPIPTPSYHLDAYGVCHSNSGEEVSGQELTSVEVVEDCGCPTTAEPNKNITKMNETIMCSYNESGNLNAEIGQQVGR